MEIEANSNIESQMQELKTDISFLAKILNNVRDIIAYDRKQKQPLILKINEGFIFNIVRKALLEKDSKLGLVFKICSKTALPDCLAYVNTHLNEIRMNREYRMKWAKEHISGRVLAKYFIDCIV